MALWQRPWLGIIFVFVAAIGQRAALPALPLSDPDVRGYLTPALEHLAGHGMPQTDSRSMAYPLVLRMTLGVFSDFHAIVTVQHILGLLSGAMWLLAFSAWLYFLPMKRQLLYIAWWLATAGLAIYLCNPSTLVFETQIRPESVFPLFSLAQIVVTLFFIRFRWMQPHLIAAILCAGLVSLLAIVCLSLKPSWGFAALTPFAVMAVSLWYRNVPARSFSFRVGPILAAGIVLILWNTGLPRLVGWIPDPAAERHLAGTLFTVHADIISKEMHHRAERGELNFDENSFLAKLDEQIAKSRGIGKYQTLGHDPDFLLFSSGVLRDLPVIAQGDSQQGDRYLRRAYMRAVVHEPWLMLQKISRQMIKGYGDASKSVFNSSMPWRSLFLETYEILSNVQLPENPNAVTESFGNTLREVESSMESQPELLRGPTWLPPRWFFYYILTWLQAVILVAGAIALFLAPWLGRQKALQRFRAGYWATIIVWACSVGSALTVSIIHSFDIDRYTRLQSSVNSLLVATGIAFAAIVVETIITKQPD